MSCCVYQAFNQAGRLLYVGLSRHWPRRWNAHAVDKFWWPEVATLQIVWLKEFEAAWYEGWLIRTQHPRYNRQIPPAFQAPDSLGTVCDKCRTWYAASLRPPETQCDNTSLGPTTMTICDGRCRIVQASRPSMTHA